MIEEKSIDTHFLWCALLLCMAGVVMVYSSSTILAGKEYQDGFYFLKKQAVWFFFGSICMAGFIRYDYHHLRRWSGIILLICTLLLMVVLVPGVGHTVGGATRWLRIPGMSIQPSELAKIGLVIFMAHSLANRKDKLSSFKLGIVPYGVLLAILLSLMLMQPDFGSAFIMASVATAMLLVAGSKFTHFLLGIPVISPVVYWLIVNEEYRLKRVLAFLNPNEDTLGANFQLNQSLTAFGSGGWFGQGLGNSKQKLFFLPEAHTDFIYSVIGEEFGFIGVAIIATIFLYMIARGIRIALQAPDQFGCFLAFGLIFLIGIEAFFNIAVTVGLLPTKGLVLPFISYGGSSLVTKMILVGILLNISQSDSEVAR